MEPKFLEVDRKILEKYAEPNSILDWMSYDLKWFQSNLQGYLCVWMQIFVSESDQM